MEIDVISLWKNLSNKLTKDESNYLILILNIRKIDQYIRLKHQQLVDKYPDEPELISKPIPNGKITLLYGLNGWCAPDPLSINEGWFTRPTGTYWGYWKRQKDVMQELFLTTKRNGDWVIIYQGPNRMKTNIEMGPIDEKNEFEKKLEKIENINEQSKKFGHEGIKTLKDYILTIDLYMQKFSEILSTASIFDDKEAELMELQDKINEAVSNIRELIPDNAKTEYRRFKQLLSMNSGQQLIKKWNQLKKIIQI